MIDIALCEKHAAERRAFGYAKMAYNNSVDVRTAMRSSKQTKVA